jgi:hypothetical protein
MPQPPRRADRRARLIVVGLLACAGAAFAPPAAEMTTVSAVRELGDGRTIVLDARARRLFLFDWSAGLTTRISREGTGPREYARPSGLIALSADSTLVHDPANDRYLVLGATGQPIGALPEFEVRSAGRSTYEVAIRDADAQGRLYFTLPRALVRDREATPILRFDRRSAIADTVGTVVEGSDDWVVLPEGGVAIVRAVPFRIEWFPAGGEPVIGPAMPYARARPSDGGPTVLLSPNRRLWVARVAGEWADAATYDVFDGAGLRIERMTFDAGSRVVGFGRARVYVVRRDATGEVFLDRFPIGD